jgi:transcription termination factor NusB
MNRITVKDMRRVAGGLEKLRLIVDKAVQDIIKGAVNNPGALNEVMPEYKEQLNKANWIVNEYLDIAKEFCIQNHLKIKFSAEEEKDVPVSGIADELVTGARNNYQELERLVKSAMRQIRE